MEKTKFKPKQRKTEGISKLITELSEKMGIEAKLLEKQSKRALKNWEKATRIKSVNLFLSEPQHISAIIPHMLTFFETEFAPLIAKQADMNVALEITNQILSDMYGVKAE